MAKTDIQALLNQMPLKDRERIARLEGHLIALADKIDDEIISLALGGRTGEHWGILALTPRRLLYLPAAGGVEVFSFSDVEGVAPAPGRRKLFGYDKTWLIVYRGGQITFSVGLDHEVSAGFVLATKEAYDSFRISNS